MFNSDTIASKPESGDASESKSDANLAKSDALDGWLGDAVHPGLTFAKQASNALLTGLDKRGAGPAASGSGSGVEQYTRDPRFLLPHEYTGWKAGIVTPDTGAMGTNKRSEAKQTLQTNCAKAAKRSLPKRQRALDGEDVDRELATTSNNDE